MVSLFTGAGGLDIGLEDAGFTTVVANDVEDYACQTLVANRERRDDSQEFHDWFRRQTDQRCYKTATNAELSALRQRLEANPLPAHYLKDAAIIPRDVRHLPSAEILAAAGTGAGEIDLVAGGPPCQPFSRAGKRQTVETAEGQLFLEFVRIVRDVRPRWFLFENVKGLAQSSTEVLRLACDTCRAVAIPPFAVRQRLLGAPDGTRDPRPCENCETSPTRVSWQTARGGSLEIILNEFESVGYRCQWRLLNAVDYGAPQFRERLIIVGSRDHEAFHWPSPTHCNTSLAASQGALPLFGAETQTSPWRTVAGTLWLGGHPKYGCLDRDTATLWVKNVVRPHDEPVTWDLDRPAPTVGAHQAAKLALAPFGVPQEQLERQQWHVLGQRQGDRPPVAVEHEYLSDEDLLRLQTFPPGWFLYGTRMQRAFQIGNAVPPTLGKVIGTAIIAASRSQASQPPRTATPV